MYKDHKNTKSYKNQKSQTRTDIGRAKNNKEDNIFTYNGKQYCFAPDQHGYKHTKSAMNINLNATAKG